MPQTVQAHPPDHLPTGPRQWPQLRMRGALLLHGLGETVRVQAHLAAWRRQPLQLRLTRQAAVLGLLCMVASETGQATKPGRLHSFRMQPATQAAALALPPSLPPPPVHGPGPIYTRKQQAANSTSGTPSFDSQTSAKLLT